MVKKAFHCYKHRAKYLKGIESVDQDVSSSLTHWSRGFCFLMYNGILFMTVLIITGFAGFSLAIEGSVIHGSSIEYITVTLSFAVLVFGTTTMISCTTVCFSSIRRRLRLHNVLRTIFTFSISLELVMLIFGIGAVRQIEELILSIVRWDVFIKYYQEEHVRTDLDIIQRELKCCGFQSYKDWDLNPYYSCNSTGYSKCSVPYSCCKLKNPDSNCVLGIRNPTNTESKLREFIYLDGCLKTSRIWYQYTIILLSFSSFLMAVLQGILLRIMDPYFRSITNRNKTTRNTEHI